MTNTVITRIRRFYGEHPLHAAIVLGCFALTGYVGLKVSSDPSLLPMLLWFAGAVIAHDLVLFPLYTLADRAAARLLPTIGRRRHPAINYLRVPVLASGLLLLLFFPGIIEQGGDTYLAATGQNQQPFLSRWLLLTAAFFAAGAIAYILRLVTNTRRGRPARSASHGTPASRTADQQERGRPTEIP